jgi:signal transduction histidine kinase
LKHSAVAVRVVWVAAVAALGALLIAALPALYLHKLDPSPAVRAGIDQTGISTSVYAAYWTVAMAAFAVLCVSVGISIVARKPAETIAWFVSLFLIALGTANAPFTEALAAQWPRLAFAATVGFFILTGSFVVLLFVFPDGRPVPTWSGPLSLVLVCAIFLLRGSVALHPTEALFAALIASLLAGLGAQVYRYRKTADPGGRKQTRNVGIAFAVAVGAQILVPALEPLPAFADPGVGALVYDLATVTVMNLAFCLVPLAIAQAVLRRRLWSRDAFINRTLVYGGLTAVLLTVFVAVAGGLGGALSADRNLLSLVGAGLVAVLFAQLRDRLQRGVNRLMYGRRDEPYEVMAELGRKLESSLAAESVLPTLVRTVADSLSLPYAAIELEGDPAPAAETGSRQPAAVRIPLVYGTERVGELVVGPRSAGTQLSQPELELLQNLARQASPAVHAVHLTRDLQSARERLVNSREEERRRIRRDLHDGLGPTLASMTLQADAARESLDADPAAARRILDDLVEQLQESTADIRRLVYELRPPALDDLGLSGALRSHLDRADSENLHMHLDLPEDLPPLPAAVEVAAFRIAQEAVANVVHHAGATSCSVSLKVADELLTVEVSDDGSGIPAVPNAGIGLRSMRERAHELGGECLVSNRPDGGTRVLARLPTRFRPAPAAS